MNKFGYKLLRILPSLKMLLYQYYNKFFLKIVGISYGSNLKVTNKVYVRGLGGYLLEMISLCPLVIMLIQ